MFKKITILLSVSFFVGINMAVNAQTNTIINYSTTNNGQCNLFNPAANVNGLLHTTTCGQVTYSTTDNAIILAANLNNGFQYGTEYSINYNFKQGCSYAITINAAGGGGNSSIYPPRLRVAFNSSQLNYTEGKNCNKTEQLNAVTQSVTNTVSPNSTTFTDYNIIYNAITTASPNIFFTPHLRRCEAMGCVPAHLCHSVTNIFYF